MPFRYTGMLPVAMCLHIICHVGAIKLGQSHIDIYRNEAYNNIVATKGVEANDGE